VNPNNPNADPDTKDAQAAQQSLYPEAGRLMSYGTDLNAGYRQCGTHVGLILKGAKPADLPVVQPTKLEFVVNLRTAKTLCLSIPLSLLAFANEVIE
jgi:putative ABC transport system substrate-binding protein